MRGLLHLVVGPSGAGKDTLIALAARARPDLHVARRVITRPEAAGGEAFDGVSAAAFARMRATGAFALDWDAHGLSYGIPAGIADRLAAGQGVIANVSRAAIPTARARLAPIRVLLVTAPDAVLAARLAARGREDAADIARRLARAAYAVPEGPDVIAINNGGSLEEGLAAFVAALSPPRTADAG